MADEFPILVDRYRRDQSVTVICTLCLAEKVVGLADGVGLDGQTRCVCGGETTFKYIEARVCPSCRKVGFWPAELAGCCSRACMLQAEYAKSLNG